MSIYWKDFAKILNLSFNKNSIATPLVQNAMHFHKLTFKYIYQYPLEIQINHGILKFKVHQVFKLKYIPFFFTLIFLTFIICCGSCVLLPFMSLFPQGPPIDVVSVVFLLFIGSCAFTETALYYIYWKAPEIIHMLNELLRIEIKCKTIKKYIQISHFCEHLFICFRLQVRKTKIYRLDRYAVICHKSGNSRNIFSSASGNSCDGFGSGLLHF